jgi:hypothetical protein
MMHRNNKQPSSSNINAQTIELKLSQLESNQATTNLSRSKLSQQALSMNYNQCCKKTLKQKI